MKTILGTGAIALFLYFIYKGINIEALIAVGFAMIIVTLANIEIKMKNDK